MSCCSRRAHGAAAATRHNAVSQVRRTCAVQTAVNEDSEVELYPLWDWQPMTITEEQMCLERQTKDTSRAAALRSD